MRRSTIPREWEKGVDGWGKPYWQNARSGEVVGIEPKGWNEAMGLGEDELDSWEAPSRNEVAKDVAVDVSGAILICVIVIVAKICFMLFSSISPRPTGVVQRTPSMSPRGWDIVLPANSATE